MTGRKDHTPFSRYRTEGSRLLERAGAERGGTTLEPPGSLIALQVARTDLLHLLGRIQAPTRVLVRRLRREGISVRRSWSTCHRKKVVRRARNSDTSLTCESSNCRDSFAIIRPYDAGVTGSIRAKIDADENVIGPS